MLEQGRKLQHPRVLRARLPDRHQIHDHRVDARVLDRIGQDHRQHRVGRAVHPLVDRVVRRVLHVGARLDEALALGDARHLPDRHREDVRLVAPVGAELAAEDFLLVAVAREVGEDEAVLLVDFDLGPRPIDEDELAAGLDPRRVGEVLGGVAHPGALGPAHLQKQVGREVLVDLAVVDQLLDPRLGPAADRRHRAAGIERGFHSLGGRRQDQEVGIGHHVGLGAAVLDRLFLERLDRVEVGVLDAADLDGACFT